MESNKKKRHLESDDDEDIGPPAKKKQRTSKLKKLTFEQHVMSLDKVTLQLIVLNAAERSEDKYLIKGALTKYDNMSVSAKQNELKSVTSKFTRKADVSKITKTVLKMYKPHQRAEARAKYPSDSVLDSFTKVLEETIDYGSKFLEVDNIEAAATVFTAFAEVAQNVDYGMMNQSGGGPSYEIGNFADKVKELIMHDDFEFGGDMAEALHASLGKFHAHASGYCYDELDEVLEMFNEDSDES